MKEDSDPRPLDTAAIEGDESGGSTSQTKAPAPQGVERFTRSNDLTGAGAGVTREPLGKEDVPPPRSYAEGHPGSDLRMSTGLPPNRPEEDHNAEDLARAGAGPAVEIEEPKK